MINELTQEQVEKLKEYREDAMKVGLSTEKCDRKEAEKWVKEAYREAGLKEPGVIIWVNDPIEVYRAISVLEKLKQNEVWRKELVVLHYQLVHKARERVDKKLVDQVREKIHHQLGVKEGLRGWYTLGLGMEHILGKVVDHLGFHASYVLEANFSGNLESHWLWDYKFFLEVLEIDSCKPMIPFIELAKNCGWWAPFKGVSILQEKPEIINMVDEKLHAENGPSISYPGGNFKVYSLYGVRVHRWIAETPIEKLDIKDILELENAEQRMVALKRFGPERLVLEGYGFVIEDKFASHGYKLINLASLFSSTDYAPHLVMKNPSTGSIHVEGVHPHCRSIQEALNWRAGNIHIKWKVFVQT